MARKRRLLHDAGHGDVQQFKADTEALAQQLSMLSSSHENAHTP